MRGWESKHTRIGKGLCPLTVRALPPPYPARESFAYLREPRSSRSVAGRSSVLAPRLSRRLRIPGVLSSASWYSLGLFASCILLINHTLAYEGPPVVPLQAVVSTQWRSRGVGQNLQRHCSGSSMVERSRQPVSREAISPSFSSGHSDNGCLYSRVGSFSGGSGGQRYLVSRGKIVSHQSFGIGSDTFGSQGLPSLHGLLVPVLTDNTTAMWYINKQGGVGLYLLCREALRLWSWAQDHQICVVANHLAGVLNVSADSLSRQYLSSHEWRLHLEVVLHIFRMWGFLQLDLFSTLENAHCPSFCSLQYPTQGALGGAFQLHWGSQLLYTFLHPFP